MAKITNYILNLPSAVCEKHLKNSGFSDTPMQQKKLFVYNKFSLVTSNRQEKALPCMMYLCQRLHHFKKKHLKHEHNICINNMFACVFATKYA
jgi:hypothetical protein